MESSDYLDYTVLIEFQMQKCWNFAVTGFCNILLKLNRYTTVANPKLRIFSIDNLALKMIKGSAEYSIFSSNNLMNLLSGQCRKGAYGLVLELYQIYLKKITGYPQVITFIIRRINLNIALSKSFTTDNSVRLFSSYILDNQVGGFRNGNSERHQKHEKCRMQFFVFLLSAVRRQEGGGKRPPELPLRNPFTYLSVKS